MFSFQGPVFSATLRRIRPISLRKDGQHGQALVELALASVVLLLMLLAIVDFGLLFGDRLAMSNAARGGARWASKHPTSWSSATTADSISYGRQVAAAR